MTRSEGDKLGFLADGLTEALIDELSAVKQLKVISRNGVAPFKGKTVAPDSIQRALKVGTMVSGTVTQFGDSLRVSVDLNDALTGNQIGKKKTITRARADVFKLQDDLAKEVALALRSSLGNEIEAVAGHPGTSNAQAWEALQRAKQTLGGVDTILATGDVQGAARRLSAADSEFVAVEAMDKKWAAPTVNRGWIEFQRVLLLGRGSGDASQVPKWLGSAEAHANRALANSPTDADALDLRATARYFKWLYNLAPDATASAKLLADAEADWRASVKSNPLQATAWNGLSHLLNNKNPVVRGEAGGSGSVRQRPIPQGHRQDDLAAVHQLRRVEQPHRIGEVVQCRPTALARTISDSPNVGCRCSRFRGRSRSVDSVWAIYREFVKRSPASLRQLDSLKGGMYVAMGLLRAGLADSAKSVFRIARKPAGRSSVGAARESKHRCGRSSGDKDQAIRALTRFFANNPQQRAFAKSDESWWFDPIRDDPRYKALVGSGT